MRGCTYHLQFGLAVGSSSHLGRNRIRQHRQPVFFSAGQDSLGSRISFYVDDGQTHKKVMEFIFIYR